MGRKKGFNWKSREVVKTEIVKNEDQVDVHVELPASDKYDDCNALVLPSVKRKTNIIKDKKQNQRILSKNQRKKLEKIVDSKKKKANRAGLLESLAQVQISPKELAMMTSLTSIQTKGVKRALTEESLSLLFDAPDGTKSINGVAGAKKRQKWKQEEIEEEEEEENKAELIDDCNVIGLEVREESSSDEESCEDDRPEQKEKEPEDIKTKEEESKNKAAQENVKSVEPKVERPVPTRISKPAVFVPVHRSAEVQAARLKLPILAEEQLIVEAINDNPVVILAGETGSGKTTQVPQFLYEAGYATNGKMIGVTEPRRVAATSMANRVAEEMNLHDGQVGYQIRFEGNVKEGVARIKFMTDGVLLREVEKDFLLTNYSVVIIDEAHERSVYSDILLGLLSRIVTMRQKRGNPLKLVIMSATMRVEDFTENQRLFKVKPPVILVEARQFPVTVHFNRRTAFDDYVSEAYRKVCKIHRQLPDGGILVFLTGQREVNALCRKLRKSFPGGRPYESDETLEGKEIEFQPEDSLAQQSSSDDDESAGKVMTKIKNKQKAMKQRRKVVDIPPKIDLDQFSAQPLAEDVEGDDAVSGDDEDLDSDLGDLDSDPEGESKNGMQSQADPPLWVLPLYSLLPSYRQQKVFQPPPEGSRLCVVATNVAETSLTIPNVRYVIDTGRMKTKFYDKVTSVSSFHVTWTSQAAANQRAGRAGRTAPGHCYRLYSSAIFNDEFEKFSLPDIARRPIDDLVLKMKSMDIVKVVNFPFPTPPDADQLLAAERRLLLLSSLEPPPRNLRLKEAKKVLWSSKITALGRAMAAYPLAPRYAKMLLLSHQHGLAELCITLVAALSVQELMLDQPGEQNPGETFKKWIAQRRAFAGVGNLLLLGDPMVLLRAVGGAECSGDIEAFCTDHGLRSKAVREVRKLRVQLTNETNSIRASTGVADIVVDPGMKPPIDSEAKLLRQIMLAGLPDHVARKIPMQEIKESEDRRKFKYAYRCPEMEDPVFLNPATILRNSAPEWIVYQDIYETDKMYVRGITAIDPQWLPVYAPTLCTFSDPLELPAPRYDSQRDQVRCHMNVTFGRSSWPLPLMELEFPVGIDRFKYFGQFFLSGAVCPPLAKYPSIDSYRNQEHYNNFLFFDAGT